MEAGRSSGPDRLTAEREALASAWPRALIAEGRGQRLAAWWVASREAARRAGQPALPRHAFPRAVADALFDARRARRMVRGLEASEKALSRERSGLMGARKGAHAGSEDGATDRISRLLLVAADGSPRFFRQVEQLRARHAPRLEVLLLECDAPTLGGQLFGRGREARAVLIDHKQAVARFLGVLEQQLDADGEGVPTRDEGGRESDESG